MNRRQFLTATSMAAGAVVTGCTTTTAPAARFTPKSRVIGANEDIRIAVVGFNSRGNDHIAGFKKIKGVRLVALCDVDSNVLEKGRADLAKDGIQVQTYTDVRKLLESGEIDAISTATPNHWHALLATWACQAGKDVYVEKPVSHNAHRAARTRAFARRSPGSTQVIWGLSKWPEACATSRARASGTWRCRPRCPITSTMICGAVRLR